MNSTLRNACGTAKVGFLLTGILGLVNSSYGHEEAVTVDKFELKIIETTSGSAEILSGDLTVAIDKILTSASLRSQYERNTNLCVAYTLRGEFPSAEAHCKRSLKLSRSANSLINSSRGLYMATREKHAIALNNLGVMHALQGNSGDARNYFESASSRSKRMSSTANRNLSALDRRGESIELTTS